MDDLNRAFGDPQLFRHDLREHGFMALTVAVRPDHDRDVAGGIHPHRRRIIKPDPGPEDADQMRRRDAASLDPGRQTHAAQLAALGAGRSTPFKPGDIGDFHHLVERGLIVAGVIGQRHRSGIGEHVRGDEVFRPHRKRVKPQFAAHLVDHPFQTERRLGPPGPAIGIDRGGVGEHRFHIHIDVGHLVRPGHQRAMQERRRDGGKVRQVRPDIGHGFGAERDEGPVFLAGQFDLCHMVTAMGIRQEAFRAFRRPPHRAVQLFGGGQHQSLFAIVIDL